MRNVYRIETANGRGICAATGSPLCYEYSKGGHPECEHCGFTHAAWQKLSRCQLDTQQAFAFPSEAALKEWFPSSEGRAAMQKRGAQCSVYAVPDAAILAETPHQLVFDKAQAKIVRTVPLA